MPDETVISGAVLPSLSEETLSPQAAVGALSTKKVKDESQPLPPKSYFPRKCLRSLIKRSLPQGYKAGSEAIDELDKIIEKEIGGIIYLSMSGIESHKILNSDDLKRGLKLWHGKFIDDDIGTLNSIVGMLTALKGKLDWKGDV